MQPRAALLLGLLVLGGGGVASSLRVGDGKNRPVTKVINLLKDMLKQLEKESEEDEDIYEKMGCWCVTYEKEKKKSIADGKSRIVELSSSVEQLGAEYAQLTTEVANTQKELDKNVAALEAATALRKKQLAEFDEEEKDALTSITSLKSAVVTLSAHHGEGAAALLQKIDGAARANVLKVVQSLLTKHKDMLAEAITPSQRRMLAKFASFADKTPSYFDETSLAQAGAPASGEIYGILKGMKENFEGNLAKSQKEEVTNVQAYEDLKAAKKAEMEAQQAQIDDKSVAASTADEKKAADSEDLEDTEATLAEDTKFLADLQTKCANSDADFAERTKTRQMEIEACSKALEFLSSDEAHDLFTRTFNPALLQKSSKTDKARRAALVEILSKASQHSADPRLSMLASQARLDAFEEVKKTIQDMIDKLLKEKDDDIKHKDFCIEEFNKNEVDTQNHYRERDQILAAIEDHAMTVANLQTAIENLKIDIQSLEVNLKRAGETREKANKEYQAVVADQKATQKLLTTALEVLKGFYGGAAALVQARKAAAAGAVSQSKQPAPPGFKTYEKSAASGGVMGMMQGIIDDSKAMEAEAVRSEEDSVAAYEDFVKDTQESIEEKTKDMVHKSQEKAKTEKAKIDAEVQRDTTLEEIESLEQVDADLHKSCDFLMKNFDLRVENRDAELEALKQGLALFSGASFGAFLQHYGM